MATRRDGNQSGNRKRKLPRYKGIPSPAAAKKVGSQKRLNRQTVQTSAPTPKRTVAPVSDVRTRGDKAPRGSGHSTRAERIRKNRLERQAAMLQLLEPTGFGSNRSTGPDRDSTPREEYEGIPSPAATRAMSKEQRSIATDLAALQAGKRVPRYVRTAAAERLADAGVVTSLSETRARKSLKPKKKEPPLSRVGTQGWKGGVEFGKLASPALQILDESTRLAEFVMGGYNESIKSIKKGQVPNPIENIKAGWESGGSRKERTTGSDVLRTAGVDEALRDVGFSEKEADAVVEGAGFAGDVIFDPLTYTSFGVAGGGKVAARLAAKAAKKEFAKATAEGVSRKVAKQRASQAARKAHAKAPKNRGLTVGVGAKRTSGRATATASRRLGIPNVADKVSRSKVAEGARATLPIRPREISEADWAELKAADRERRGTIMHGTRRTARKSRAIRKALGGAQRRILPERATADSPLRWLPRLQRFSAETSAKVRDAIEAGDLSNLTKNEATAARAFQAHQEDLMKLRRDAGERPARYQARDADEPVGYVSRQAAADLVERKGRRRVALTGQDIRPAARRQGSQGTTAARTTSLKDWQRTERRPMAEVRGDDPGRFVEDLPTTLLAKGQKDVRRAAHTRYRGRVMEQGRPLKQGAKWNRETEAVYTVQDGRLVEVDASKKFSPGTDHVILSKAVANHANETMKAAGRLPFVDATTNKIKWLLTVPNPQYWARNAYGGVSNVYQSGVPARHIVRDAPTAAKVNRAITRRFRAEETLGRSSRSGRSVKVLPKGKSMDMDEFLDELERVNLSGGGQTQELLGAEVARRGVAQGAEDFPRLVAYVHARRAGKSPDASAAFALKSQFDYGDLSHTEQAWARRIFPFWTFRSRNVVFQTRTLFERPGKIANIEKLRDSLAAVAGLKEDWQDRLTEAEKLGVPFPMPFTMNLPGEGKTPVLIFPALPITDLNLLTLSFPQLGQQIAGSGHPLPKAVAEYLMGYSIFFREHLEQPYSRWTAAPDFLIEDLPKGARERLVEDGVIRKGKDRWTGKVTWQWRAKTDYLSNLFPILAVGTAQATSGRNRAGRNSAQQLFAWFTGLRPKPYVPKTNQLYDLYEDREQVRQALEDFSELRVGKKSKEYSRLQDEMKRLDVEIYKREGKLGKKDRGEKPSGLKEDNPFGSSRSDGGDNPFGKSSSKSDDNPF